MDERDPYNYGPYRCQWLLGCPHKSASAIGGLELCHNHLEMAMELLLTGNSEKFDKEIENV